MSTISVAMCTYNGARYVAEQLQSLAAQERLPDEVVICDDVSSDETVDLVQRFAEEAPFPVHFFVNPKNLGSTANFAAVIERCSGDIIALADQDDVWLPEKLGRLELAFELQDNPGFVFSDAYAVDQAGAPLDYTLWQAVGFGKNRIRRLQAGHAFEVLLKRDVVTGATMAFRAEYRDLVLPIAESWVHDGWIALLISAVAPCVAVEIPLINYRQHGDQQIGEKRRSLLQELQIARQLGHDYFQRYADRFSAALERLENHPQIEIDRQKLIMLEEKIAHWQSRARMREPRAWRFPRILKEAVSGRYRKYSLGWKCMAQDAFL